MNTFDSVVAYVYRAEIVCPKCLRRSLYNEKKISIEMKTFAPEDILDSIAEELGLNRYDEYSFDSDYFPKVIFSTDAEFGYDECHKCGKSVYK